MFSISKRTNASKEPEIVWKELHSIGPDHLGAFRFRVRVWDFLTDLDAGPGGVSLS